MIQSPAPTITANSKDQMVARLLAAVELMELGVALMRQNIARKMPGATPDRISRELRRWLIDQPTHFVVDDSITSEDL